MKGQAAWEPGRQAAKRKKFEHVDGVCAYFQAETARQPQDSIEAAAKRKVSQYLIGPLLRDLSANA
jgi:hypothetical protein